MWRAFAAQGNGLPSALETPEALRSALGAEKTSVWIDFFQATPEEVQLLAEMFALDPLTVEDCVADLHHPKIDDFEHYLYLVVHGVKAGSRRGEMKTVELDVVIEKNALVTFRHEEMRSVSETWQKAVDAAGLPRARAGARAAVDPRRAGRPLHRRGRGAPAGDLRPRDERVRRAPARGLRAPGVRGEARHRAPAPDPRQPARARAPDRARRFPRSAEADDAWCSATSTTTSTAPPRCSTRCATSRWRCSRRTSRSSRTAPIR